MPSWINKEEEIKIEKRKSNCNNKNKLPRFVNLEFS
jgi:hypothetical protein